MLHTVEEAKNIILGEYSLEDIYYMSEGEKQDLISELADTQVDVYNNERLEWLQETTNGEPNYYLVDEARAEFGASDDLIEEIGLAQYLLNERLLQEAIGEIEEEAKEEWGE